MALWLDANCEAHHFIPVDYWRQHFEDVRRELKSSFVLVCKKNDVIAGFSGMQGSYLAGLFVAKDYRDHGIGSELLFACLSRAPVLTLRVFKKNIPAVDFYLRHWFRIEGKYVDDATGEEEYLMANGQGAAL